MDISLVIRTLNEEKNIGKCLDTVAQQTLMPKEIIITDNMSEDNTLKIVRTYQKKLPIRIINNPIIGFSSGLTLGIENAKYNYVAFLSADCKSQKNWLKNLATCMQKEACAVAQGREVLAPENIIHDVLNTEGSTASHPIQINYFNYTNTLCDKKILQSFLPFRNDKKYLYGEDTLISIDYKKRGYSAFLVPAARVEHSKFASKEDFQIRVFKHSRSSVRFFLLAPLHPRIYLNSEYWILKEFCMSVYKRDIRYLKVSFWRLTATVRGTISGIYGLFINN